MKIKITLDKDINEDNILSILESLISLTMKCYPKDNKEYIICMSHKLFIIYTKAASIIGIFDNNGNNEFYGFSIKCKEMDTDTFVITIKPA